MKRLIALLGVFALLGTLFVLATASPSSAQLTAGIQIMNNGTTGTGQSTITATGYCGPSGSTTGTVDVPANAAGTALGTLIMPLDCGEVNIVFTATNGQCIVNTQTAGPYWPNPAPPAVPTAFLPAAVATSSTGTCVSQPGVLTLEKRPDGLFDIGAVALSEYGFAIAAPEIANVQTAAESAACQPGGPAVHSQMGGVAGDTLHTLNVQVVDVPNNTIHTCQWSTAEISAPAGQTCISGTTGPSVAPALCVNSMLGGQITWVGVPSFAPSPAPTGLSTHINEVDPVPMTVTKTFVGRDYYTTVDRGDFHIYTPGFCSGLPLDPFGGLLGNFGIYRTINASQAPQIVWLTPFIVTASPLGPCTYRVQENNMPDGCVAVDPDGSDADGPYWDQTWEPGLLAMNFNIVNDCSPPEEPPPPAKKPGSGAGAKKPSGGGSAAPKFTG